MFCRKCGNEIPNGKVCGKCGFDQEQLKYVNVRYNVNTSTNEKVYSNSNRTVKKNMNKHKKLIIKICVGVLTLAVLVGVGIYGYMYFFGSLKTERQCDELIEMIDERKINDAYDLYEMELVEKFDIELIEDFTEKMSSEYAEIIDEYNAEELDGASIEVLKILMNKIGVVSNEYSEFLAQYQILKESKKNYTQGVICSDNGDYSGAIAYLVQVSSKDINYEAAKSKTKELIECLINESDEGFDAMSILNTYANNFTEEEYASIKNSIINSVVTTVNDKVDTYLENDEYRNAENYLSEMEELYYEYTNEISARLETLKEEYLNEVKAKAQEYFNAKDYGKAASTINIAMTELGNNDIELEELYYEYKSYLGVYIDEMDYFALDGTIEEQEDLKDNTGTVHKHSFGVDGIIDYLLNEKYDSFSGSIALAYYGRDINRIYYYEIYADEKLIYTSPEMTSGSLPISFNIDVKGTKILQIISYCGSRNQMDHYNYGTYLKIYDGIFNREQ